MLATQPKHNSRRALCATVAGCAVFACCAGEPGPPSIEAQFDKNSGQLSQLTVSKTIDGKPNITSYMAGNKFLHIEIDADEDGRIDRWEYYGDEQKLHKVGTLF